jgi:polar amino acid transport system permease protein
VDVVDDYRYLLSRYLPMFLAGMKTTAEVSVLGFVLAILIGLLGAGMRRSRVWAFTIIAGAYVEIIRNTPMLVQVFLIYFGLPSIGLKFTNFQAAVIALGVSGGAYLIEIIRSGFEAVPKGQWEAAATIGLSRTDAYLRVLLPQALRIVYPPIIGQFLQMILGSSLLSVIGLTEITGQAQLVNDETYLSMPTFIIALVAYLILTNTISILAGVTGYFLFKPRLDLFNVSGKRFLSLLGLLGRS